MKRRTTRSRVESLLAEKDRAGAATLSASRAGAATLSASQTAAVADFGRVNVFKQILTKGANVKRFTRPTPTIEWTWTNRFVPSLLPPPPKRHCLEFNIIKIGFFFSRFEGPFGTQHLGKNTHVLHMWECIPCGKHNYKWHLGPVILVQKPLSQRVGLR